MFELFVRLALVVSKLFLSSSDTSKLAFCAMNPPLDSINRVFSSSSWVFLVDLSKFGNVSQVMAKSFTLEVYLSCLFFFCLNYVLMSFYSFMGCRVRTDVQWLVVAMTSQINLYLIVNLSPVGTSFQRKLTFFHLILVSHLYLFVTPVLIKFMLFGRRNRTEASSSSKLFETAG